MFKNQHSWIKQVATFQSPALRHDACAQRGFEGMREMALGVCLISIAIRLQMPATQDSWAFALFS